MYSFSIKRPNVNVVVYGKQPDDHFTGKEPSNISTTTGSRNRIQMSFLVNKNVASDQMMFSKIFVTED